MLWEVIADRLIVISMFLATICMHMYAGSFRQDWYHALLEGEKLKSTFRMIVVDFLIYNCMVGCIKYPGQA